MASAKPAWWLAVDGQSYGPYDLRTMQAYIAEGRVTGDSIVCKVGDQTWSPARGDTLLFRAGAPQAPPFQGTAPPAPGGVAPAAGYVPPAGDAGPPVLGTNKKILLAVLGAALVGLFFAPWIDVMMFQVSGFDLVRAYRTLQQWGGGAGVPGMPGMPPGQRPPVQLDMGWREYQPYLLYLIPLFGIATLATALAGLRLWRVCAIGCGVAAWSIVALAAVQAGDAGIGWSQVQDSLRYLAFGAYGTLAVATVTTAVGFTRG